MEPLFCRFLCLVFEIGFMLCQQQNVTSFPAPLGNTMHEMSLCEGMLRIIKKQAQKDGFRRVLTVRVGLGDYAGASEESLRFCFPIMARGTVAEEAEMEFIRTPDRTLRIIDLDVV